jgi:hypothetical protein
MEENVALDHSRSATLKFDPVATGKQCFNIVYVLLYSI